MTDIWIKIECPPAPEDDPQGPTRLAGTLVQLIQYALPPVDGASPVSAYVGTPTGMHYDDQADESSSCACVGGVRRGMGADGADARHEGWVER